VGGILFPFSKLRNFYHFINQFIRKVENFLGSSRQSLCNNCVIGHIEGFCESYQKALRIYGYDEDEIRKKTIISLFEHGFEQEYVNEVIKVDEHEWAELTKGHTADIKERKAFYAEVYRKGIECMKEFERTHPRYFDETSLLICTGKTKDKSE
ncbi:MAG: hypothetical protein UDS46_07865, partial [Bacteroidales bacterium]|nr:hypothetical protein [Bacteroidales bacterium]